MLEGLSQLAKLSFWHPGPRGQVNRHVSGSNEGDDGPLGALGKAGA